MFEEDLCLISFHLAKNNDVVRISLFEGQYREKQVAGETVLTRSISYGML